MFEDRGDFGIEGEQTRARVLYDKLELAGRRSVGTAHRCASETSRSRLNKNEFRAVLHHDDDAITASNTALCERFGDGVDPLIKLEERVRTLRLNESPHLCSRRRRESDEGEAMRFVLSGDAKREGWFGFAPEHFAQKSSCAADAHRLMHPCLLCDTTNDSGVKQRFFAYASELGQLVLELHGVDCSRAAFGGSVIVVSTNNRRTDNRAAIELNVEYKRLNTFFADYTRNISKGGTFIRTDKPLDINTEFVFALTIKNVPDPLRLRGRVRWIVRPADATPESPAGMGIEFMYRNDAERRATEEVVEKLMVEELGEELAARLLGHDVEIR